MRRIMDSGAFLLGTDLALEVRCHTLEFGDHAFNLHDSPAFFVGLKLLQANVRVARLHRSYSPEAPTTWHPSTMRPRRRRRHRPQYPIVAG